MTKYPARIINVVHGAVTTLHQDQMASIAYTQGETVHRIDFAIGTVMNNTIFWALRVKVMQPNIDTDVRLQPLCLLFYCQRPLR